MDQIPTYYQWLIIFCIHGLRLPLVSYHAHNAQTQAYVLLSRLKRGESWGLVTDQGMPGVSDPGPFLVRLCHDHNIPTTVLPGPSAVTAALSLAGLAGQTFYFQGFLPRKGAKIVIKSLKTLSSLVVFFESSPRILATLDQLHQSWGPRNVTCMRELTKKFETLYTGSFPQVIEQIQKQPVKGEWVFVVEGFSASDYREHITETLSHIFRASSSPEMLRRTLDAFPHACKRKLYQALHNLE